jgi:hypothetical protein
LSIPEAVRPRRLVLLSAAVVFLGGCIATHSNNPTPAAKRDDPIYRDTRRADVLGLAPTSSFGTSFAPIGSLAAALRDGAPDIETTDPTADEEWHEETIAVHKKHIDEARSTYAEPFLDTRLRFYYVDETVKFYNEQGRDFDKGANLYVSHRASAKLWKYFLFTAEPELSVVEHLDNPIERDPSTVLRFQELNLKLRLGPTQITVGRTPLWLGPGRHGTLLVSNNARPFDLIQLGTSGPTLLPGFLGYLGLVQANLFATRLESARAVAEPTLAGLRLSTRLFPYLELGATRTAQFGGKGRAVDLSTIWEVITASTENDADDPGNQIASLDARIIVPWFTQPFELYGEYGGEDEADHFFSNIAYIVGLYFPRIGPWHAFELTLEAADTSVSGKRRVWYTNSNYPDGYTYHDRIIGHHVGSDGRDLFAELRWHPFEDQRDLTAIFSYDYEEHFREDPVTETLHQVRFGVEKGVWDNLFVSVFLGIDTWKNFRQRRGADQEGHLIGFAARWNY